MNFLREFFYRPKRTDSSLMAQFYYADEALTATAAELESLDGHKDHERFSSLVKKLRSCQNKVLTICSEMLEELEPGRVKKAREFRAKYPDDIVTDNLACQVWFGAVFLAAGSSIAHKEIETKQMRPLAKAVTKSLDILRKLLRDQCLTHTPEYTKTIREHLKFLDRMFAEFEYNYVCSMVHVKSVKEYEVHQDLIILFSDTLLHAIRARLVLQDMVDECDPSLMFAIPRLAIVYGLLIRPEGPLNVNQSNSNFPGLFLPFKNLLRKIQELLQALSVSEISVLEMLLCQLEDPANISTKLKEVDLKQRMEGAVVEAKKLHTEQASPKTCNETPIGDRSSKDTLRSSSCTRFNVVPYLCEDATAKRNRREAHAVASALIDEILTAVFYKDNLAESFITNQRSSDSLRTCLVDTEIDYPLPEIKIRVSPQRREASQQFGFAVGTSYATQSHHFQETSTEPSTLELSSSVPSPSLSSSQLQHTHTPRMSPELKEVVSKCQTAKHDSQHVHHKHHKDRRVKFKSIEDLLHRLYVCISGAADQLQSNFADDFRAILRAVFTMNATSDEVNAADANASKIDPCTGASNLRGAVAHATAEPPEEIIPPVDLGTDALHHEFGRELYRLHLRQTGQHDNEHPYYDDERFEEPSPDEDNIQAYGPNFGMYAFTQDFSIQRSREFFQPEPAVLNVASRSANEGTPEILTSQLSSDEVFEDVVMMRPPPWIPDSVATHCFGCANSFTVIRRRHHCRDCGRVFCSRCSSRSVALPQYGLPHPVRVCNHCHPVLDPVHTSLSNTLTTTPSSFSLFSSAPIPF